MFSASIAISMGIACPSAHKRETKTSKSVVDKHLCGRKKDIMIKTNKGPHNSPFEQSINILRYIFNPAGNMRDSLEEMMQSANKAWWRETRRVTKAKMYRGDK